MFREYALNFITGIFLMSFVIIYSLIAGNDIDINIFAIFSTPSLWNAILTLLSITSALLTMLVSFIFSLRTAIRGDREKKQFYINFLRTMEWSFFALTIVGAAVAIKFVQSGTIMSVVASIFGKATEKLKDYLREKWHKREEDPQLDANCLLARIEQLEQMMNINNRNEELMEANDEQTQAQIEMVPLQQSYNS